MEPRFKLWSTSNHLYLPIALYNVLVLRFSRTCLKPHSQKDGKFVSQLSVVRRVVMSQCEGGLTVVEVSVWD